MLQKIIYSILFCLQNFIFLELFLDEHAMVLRYPTQYDQGEYSFFTLKAVV